MADLSQQIAELNDRLIHLEAVTAPSLLSLASEGRRDLQGSLLRSVAGIYERLRQIASERRNIGEFYQNYANIEKFLSIEQEKIINTSLDLSTKRDIVLASEEDLRLSATQLKEVQNLSSIIEAEPFRGKSNVGKLIPTLSTAEVRYGETRRTVEQMQDQLSQILRNYSQFINTLSDLFIWYEEQIATLEQRVVQEEQARATRDS
ncbi:hypothetical protein DFS34DRAFT_594690 [Phlyctochytrium arcticum]|nr:hypothetical protein DFS34DRAFT_594690 [Phlyctochytrium arcticum]